MVYERITLLLPILVPFMTTIALIPLRRNLPLQRRVTAVGTFFLLAAALNLLSYVHANGPAALPVGNWPAPFGVILVADLFSAIMVVMTGIMGFGVALYSFVDIRDFNASLGFYILYNILLTGVAGAFLTGDLFNLYVWFEVLLISSFVLLALGGQRAQLEGALKYVTLNLLASTLFLSAIGLTYGLVGSLNMADIALRIGAAPAGMVTTVAVLFLVAFGIKSAIFPLFTWLPASYHTPPVSVTAIFSGLMTKVGVYAILRVFSLLFLDGSSAGFLRTLILATAGLTMITGVLGAVAQTEVRRLLSFHIVSQIGYLIMGIGLFTPLAIAGTLFFLVHVIIAKSALFLVSGVVYQMRGTFFLKKVGGIYRENPGTALLFLVPALALAGIPPLSGFWAKLALFRAGLAAEQYLIVAVGVVVSLLTLLSMMKIWTQAYWSARAVGQPQGKMPNGQWWPLLLPTAALALGTLFIGLFADSLFALTLEAAEQLLDPAAAYIPAVLAQ